MCFTFCGRQNNGPLRYSHSNLYNLDNNERVTLHIKGELRYQEDEVKVANQLNTRQEDYPGLTR